MRVGTGFDVHQFIYGRKLILGGVEIPHDKGLDGHSDADVLLHAITDAILGAIAAGDIGHHFPPSDEKWRNCDSLVFLQAAAGLAKKKGYAVSNVDAVILAERPKILPHVESMTLRISKALSIPQDCVSIKATTMETMGFVGREEGIAATAVALLERLP